MRYLLVLLTALCVGFAGGCTQDSLPEPTEEPCADETLTYTDDVEEIVERTCSYSGCHLGGAPGLYDSYDGLRSDLESGLFRQRVIELRDDPVRGMPPAYAPANRPDTLTEAELTIVRCWLEAGFPE